MTIFEYNKAIKLLRDFFQEEKGFIEIPAQSRKSILAACEDPETVSQYIFEGQNWPLPQTGQMWLEKELVITSYSIHYTKLYDAQIFTCFIIAHTRRFVKS